ncbi:DUF1987 domain-containing protein [Rapidithrix thailandica]|uniref:DUF1987 domain-containing protein n=1 Tax=Rapidithrix thailandica TaxID=413964 RepID=A0AAW9RYH0_9BACT
METIKLDRLEFESENNTFFKPHILFDAETGECLIEGESYLEDTWEFYSKPMEWLRAYTTAEVKKPIDFKFKLSYFNTSSSKCILDILKLLKQYQENGGEVTVSWYYPEDDEDNLMEAEDFIADTGIDMKLVEY